MKKILACLFAVSVISAAAFSKNFFSQRFFEIKIGAEADASNNLITMNDIMKKDLVIDLKQLADDCPQNGFNIREDAAPSIGWNLYVKDFHIGVKTGAQIYENIEIGKDLFNFLGYGNSVGESMNFKFTNDTDVFYYTQLGVGFKIGRLKVNAEPALFIPLVSIRGGGGTIDVINDAEGNLKLGMNLNMDVYSAVPLKRQEDGNGVTMDGELLQSTIMKGYGFDLGGGVTIPLPFFNALDLEATCRIPIIPGHLNYKSSVTGGFDYEMKLTDFENAKKTEKETAVSSVEETIDVHRPLKFDVYLNKELLGGLFNARAGAGFGIRRPFCDAAVFYPKYYLGLGLNLIDMLKIGVSTQYTDQLFIHQVGATVNIRFIQLDVGVSAQSSSFTKSMAIAGAGAYAYVTIGF